jgi:hypothetical protein
MLHGKINNENLDSLIDEILTPLIGNRASPRPFFFTRLQQRLTSTHFKGNVGFVNFNLALRACLILMLLVITLDLFVAITANFRPKQTEETMRYFSTDISMMPNYDSEDLR